MNKPSIKSVLLPWVCSGIFLGNASSKHLNTKNAITPEMAAAVSKIIRNQDLVLATKNKVVTVQKHHRAERAFFFKTATQSSTDNLRELQQALLTA